MRGNLGSVLTCRHSGNIGDILYSIPAALALAKQSEFVGIEYKLRTGVQIKYSGPHPLGNVLLTDAYVEFLKPLLEYQPYFKSVYVDDGQPVHVNLDDFRRLPISPATGNIPTWFLWMLQVNFDLSKPWITSPVDAKFSDKILVSRTFRHRSDYINYRFMKNYASQIVFVGVESEWQSFNEECPDCHDWIQFDDMLSMAAAFRACKFFVGNQGMPFTLAECLKVPRILESNRTAPNNQPIGGVSFSCLFQQHIEKTFSDLAKSS